jgi:hypothetical protein
MTENAKILKIIDRSIFVFYFIFLATLTNSIFLNQLGYYGALILLLIRYYYTKKNPFNRTGLELAFFLFILAEFLSTIFSAEIPHSFVNLLKRFFLIPIVYTTIAASNDIKKAKFFFKAYITFALISVGIYLWMASRYYFYNLFQIEQSGPSVFQYPITASEIMSFASIFLFAFLINEKTRFVNKILISLGFFLTIVAIVATYKRTGWLGTSAGLFIILLIKKERRLIIPLIIIFIVLLIKDKNISEIYFFNYIKGEIVFDNKLSTPGRAYDVLPVSGNEMFVSDYEDGILKIKNSKIQSNIELPSPVGRVLKVEDSRYLACLADSRFVLMEIPEQGKYKILREFASPGLTLNFDLYKNKLYVVDQDSGLTIFPNLLKPSINFRYPNLTENFYVFVDSMHIVFYSKEKGITVFHLNNFLPGSEIAEYKPKTILDAIDYLNGKLIFSENNNLVLCGINPGGINILKRKPGLGKIILMENSDSSIIAANTQGQIFKIRISAEDFKIEKLYDLGFIPSSINQVDNKFYVTQVKRSRLLSIFDLYNESNYNRIELWKAGLKIFRDRPVFGVGDIDLGKLYKKYKNYYDKEIQGHMHNNFIHILVILGSFGFIVFIYLIVRILLIDIKIYKKLKDREFVSSYSLGVIGTFVAFLVSGLTEWNFGDHEIVTMVWFVLGLNIAFYNFYLKEN